jgi:hypothetical protein
LAASGSHNEAHMPMPIPVLCRTNHMLGRTVTLSNG